jgi:Helix-hairpin-helix domain
VDNARIADRLEELASLLDLSDANPYTARAYRRAAETIRSAPLPVQELVRTRRVRQLRGIGSGIEARLRELVETADIAELAELSRKIIANWKTGSDTVTLHVTVRHHDVKICRVIAWDVQGGKAVDIHRVTGFPLRGGSRTLPPAFFNRALCTSFHRFVSFTRLDPTLALRSLYHTAWASGSVVIVVAPAR